MAAAAPARARVQTGFAVDGAVAHPDAVTFKRAIVVGAGLAGLSAAVALRRKGIEVSIFEAAAQAGGRCRSYHDPQLGMVIDNGNHLVLSGNQAVARFRKAVGAKTPLSGPNEAAFPFHDLRDGQSWTIRINKGRVPWWVLFPGRRVPGTRLPDYLRFAGLAKLTADSVAAHVRTEGPVWEKLLEPVLLAVLNTTPAHGAGELVGNVVRETLGRGGGAMLPRIAEPTLAAAFIDPALAWLEAQGSPVVLNRRLQTIGFPAGECATLDWGEGPEPIDAETAVVLAVPPWVATGLVPGLKAPDAFRSIVNAHFACTPPPGALAMLGVLGGTAEWLFAFPNRISVTVSAADCIVGRNREHLARTFWSDIQRAYGFAAPMPRWQIVKEKRATFAATPEQNAKRPPATTSWPNLFLAGDWVQTGLPATIEGALRSGETAAALVIGRGGR
jgi:squalene-associated FAD-dependent desaturase